MFRLSRRSFTFALNKSFLARYERKTPGFGFNGLGEIVYRRSYARVMENGEQETWPKTVERVVNGTFRMLERSVGLDESSRLHAEVMYDLIFNFKFLPPGRGLWAMGSPLTESKGLYTALNNCAFVSTQDITPTQAVRPFTFLMDASMLGVGVGFDTKGAGKLTIHKPLREANRTFVIPDSREGWVESLSQLLSSYFRPDQPHILFDYSLIRPAGTPLVTFGGIASGPGPLQDLHNSLFKALDTAQGQALSSRLIVDVMNLIGKCVVAGNIRRTAEIAFGMPEDKEFLKLKDYSVHPERAEYGWTSNNSLFANIGMDYAPVADYIRKNGEPGLAWLDNMRRYGRMADPPNDKDYRAMGGNPCLEQTLESYELCCLVEVFISRHKSLDEFLQTLKYAFMYAKIVTLGQTHWPETNAVMSRNRRIGCSLTGIAQFLANRSLEDLRKWCDTGYKALKRYDAEYSASFSIPESIKITSIKPSGTVSLLAGATPGLHFPHSRHYLRRMRFPKSDTALLSLLTRRGYHIEADLVSKESMIVSVPVRLARGVRTLKEVSMWEQVSLAAFMQRHWADNQVSCTVSFKEREGEDIERVLEHFQYGLKGISFLPDVPGQPYKQMPYEEISEETYRLLTKDLKLTSKEDTTSGGSPAEAPRPDDFCDACERNLL
jgi:adenosylcobalamin-dependent ribonucleoside-triphosphate reductase